MLYNQFAFVPASPKLLTALNPMESAVQIARKELAAEPVFNGLRCYADLVPKNIGIATLSQLVYSSSAPMDSVIPVSTEGGEISGWYVCLWYNEDDFDEEEDDDEE